MNTPVLPPPESVRIYGRGVARAIRVLYAERCSVEEIKASLHVPGERIAQAVRWKSKSCIHPASAT